MRLDRNLRQRLAQQVLLLLVECCDPLAQYRVSPSLDDRVDLAREVRGEDRLHVRPRELLDRFARIRESWRCRLVSLRRV
jgi:hypothetical protein